MQKIRIQKTAVIGSVIIDVYRLVDKMKNEKNLDANIREKGTVAWTVRRRVGIVYCDRPYVQSSRYAQVEQYFKQY